MRRLSATDLAVLLIRVGIITLLLLAYRFVDPTRLVPEYAWLLRPAVLVAVTTTGVFALALLLAPGHSTLAYRIVVPFDLGVAGAAILAAEAPEPVYVALLALVAGYALIFDRSFQTVVAVGAAGTWFLGSMPAIGSPYLLVTRSLQASALLAIGAVVYYAVSSERSARGAAEGSASQLEAANLELTRRVTELNAISEIAIAIHSTLDFEQVGRLVLEILQKVLNLTECSLMIIDRQTGETLFTASHGLADETSRELALGDLDEAAVESEEGVLRCIPLLSHEKITAVLCASSEAIDTFTDEDMLVLAAIASELAVAVDNAQLYKLTKRLAVTDELTGLSNYRYLRQRLDLEIERAQRYLRPVSLLMIDVDDFKGHNDTYGHASGDQVLADLAQALKAKCRELDVVARYGGEEFAIILPETDASGAVVVAEKLREAVAVHSFEGSPRVRDVRLTISVGVATYPIHAGSAEELLKQADDALYKAKATGRDRVCSPPKERAVT